MNPATHGSLGGVRIASLFFAAVVVSASGACGGDERRSGVDSLNAIDTLKPMDSQGEGVSVDSSAMRAPAGSPAATGELPPAGGETSRRGSSITPQYPVTQDPPPNLTGETRNPGGTMPRGRERDSATGPKLMIDEKGNVTPIKR